MKEPKILVNIKTYQRKWPINRQTVRNFVQKIFKAGVQQAVAFRRLGKTEVTIVFLNDGQMQFYNRTYRKKDYATDVLSFPVNETFQQYLYLGDILISLDRAAHQAKEKRHSAQREVKILLLHGVLHLLGYDHEADRGQMTRLENRLRRALEDKNDI